MEFYLITNLLIENLIMGNLDAKRDWGHAKDYVEGMLYLDKPDE